MRANLLQGIFASIIMYMKKLMTEEQQQLVIDYYNLIHFVLKRYKNQIPAENYDDYEQVSAVALCLAAMRFNENKGLSFTTFAVPYIEGFIRRYRMQNMYPVKFTRGEFYKGEGKNATFISLNQPVSESDGSAEFGDLITSEQMFEDDVLFELDVLTALQENFSEEDVKIFKLYFCGYNQQEIAEMKKCSQTCISRKIKKAKKLILNYMNDALTATV